MKLITFLSAGLFVLASAFTIKQASPSQDSPLYQTKWILKKMTTASGMEAVVVPVSLRMHQEKKSAGGNGGCNTYGSTLSVNGSRISFSEIFSTKMFCEGAQATEDRYFALLGKVNHFVVRGNQLLLYDNQTLLLQFEATEV